MSARNSPRLTALLAPCFIIAAVFPEYAAGQTSCSASNGRPGVCVPMVECEITKLLLEISPKPLPPAVSLYIRNSHCGTVNNQYYGCCDVTQYRGVITNVTPTAPRQPPPPPPPPPPARDPDARSRVPGPRLPPFSSGKPDPSSIGLSTLQALSCGTMDNYRVANGVDANLSEFPWMALLVYETGMPDVLGCGGSLITVQHVLTAAHCIRVPASRKLVAVRLGEHDTTRQVDCSVIKRKCAPPVQEIGIAEAIVHEDYHSATLSNDIGILRLESEAVIKSSVIPICLPITDSSKALPNRFVIAGWGNAENGHRTPILQKALVGIADNVTCRSMYSTIPISETQVCAGGEDGVQTCMGDSGGPLMYPARHGKRARVVQYGIVSGGSRSCGTEYPGVYTLIEPYLQWITTKIATMGQTN